MNPNVHARYGLGMRSRVAMAVAAITLLAACNGDDDAEPTTTTAVHLEETTTSSARPTTTAAPDPETTRTTAPETSTTQEQSTTTNVVPATDPTTTADPDDYTAQGVLVIKRVEESWRTVRMLLDDPFDDDKLAALDGYFTGNQLEGFRNVVQDYRDQNLRSVDNPDVPEVYTAEPASLALDLEAGRATVQVCHRDSTLLVETAGNPDGTDRVVIDDVSEMIVELDVKLVDGVWKVSSARVAETEIAQCP